MPLSKDLDPDVLGILPDRNDATLELLLRRRSLVVAKQTGPGPSPEELDILLRCATRVPDHAKLTPWRIAVVQGAAQRRLGEVFADTYRRQDPDASKARIETERQRPQRAPLLLIVSSKIESERVPRLEQLLSGAAVCQNILIAATALGYASQWLTEWVSYDPEVKRYLHIAERDEILGFLYIGRASEAPRERPRPELEEVVIYL